MTMTALLGRVFCGWACPQTVFLEGVFRRLERILEGPRETRIRRDTGPWTTGKLGRKILLHTAYLVASFGIAHIFLSYFVSVPGALAMMKGSPRDHLEAFVWAMGMTAFFYANFAWFREQMCLVVCPYGRLQAVLVDNHTLSVGYDSLRGEPRRVRGPGVQQPQQGNHGDCVDCRRCIAVCPTGIDIRNGPQLDCIGCTGCIDACDEIMGNLGRPAGLIRYDSLEGFAGKPSHFLRSRTLFYGAALLVGALAAGLAFARRTPYEANLLRIPGPPFTEVDGYVQNVFEVHVASKAAEAQTIRLTSESFGPNTTIVMPIHEVHLSPLSSQRLPVLVRVPKAQFTQEFDLRIRVSPVSGDGHGKLLMGRVLGAKS
jgi:cytochrome c oxidase accessory protein FixG